MFVCLVLETCRTWCIISVNAGWWYGMSKESDATIAEPNLFHIWYTLTAIIMIAVTSMINNGTITTIGDKAYNNDEEMKGVSHPHIAVHGSFSLMVNYAALRHYIDTKGGFSMATPYSDGFKVACFCTGVAEVITIIISSSCGFHGR